MTVYARRIASTPARTPSQTWETISKLLGAREETTGQAFRGVAGVMSSIIADQYPASDPIVVVGSGPRVRIYCLYGDSALGDEANEKPVHEDLLDAEWCVYVPVGPKDLPWVRRTLESHPGFVAYDPKKGVPATNESQVQGVVEMQPNQEAWAKL